MYNKMASAAHAAAKVSIATLLLLAANLMLMGAAAASSAASNNHGGCIRRVHELVPISGSCECYDWCADTEKGGLTTASSQRCFVNCVLGTDCVCPGGDDYGDGDDKVVFPVLPAQLLDHPVRVNVRRPKVSRSRAEKNKAPEMLVVEFTFDHTYDKYGMFGKDDFTVHFNMVAEGGEQRQLEAGCRRRQPTILWPVVEDRREDIGLGKAVIRVPIGARLEYMGADADETILVSFFPVHLHYCGRDDEAVDYYRRSKITIQSVSIEYQQLL